MSTTLGEIARAIKSANAGASWITFDVLFDDAATYESAWRAEILSPSVFSDIYAVASEDVRIFGCAAIRTIKVTIPRRTASGGADETDFDGTQQFAPLLDLPVPTPMSAFAADVRSFLETTKTSVLYCRDRNGRPIGYPMTVFRVRDDALLFTTYTKSAKVSYLRADPRAACLVTGDGSAWVNIRGAIEFHQPGEAEVDGYFDANTERNDPRVPAGVTESVKARLRDGRRLIMVLRPLDPDGIMIERAPTLSRVDVR